MIRRIGRPPDGRSRSVLVYRLRIREDAVPHEGQEAVGDVVRRVSVIAEATSTSSTWTRGKFWNNDHWIFFGPQKKLFKIEKMFN